MLAVGPALGSGSIDNSLACQFASQKYVRDQLGLAHSERRHSSESPTSPSPDDHTVGPGSDQSQCEIFAWNGSKPSPTELKKILGPGSSRYKIPEGLGSVVVTTYVRDPGTDGQSWDAQAYYRGLVNAETSDRHQLGGVQITVKKYDADERNAATLGHYGDFAVGVWWKGDSIIMLQVAASRGRAAAKLKALAAKAVPPF
jgi:hypothetical protein